MNCSNSIALLWLLLTGATFALAQAPDQLAEVVYRESYSSMSGPRAVSLVLESGGRFRTLLITYSERTDAVGPRQRVAAPETGRFRYTRTGPATGTLEFFPDADVSRVAEFRERKLSFENERDGRAETSNSAGPTLGRFSCAPWQAGGMSNTSVRGLASRTRPLIVGFIVAGTHAREVLVRAIGPALTQFGIAGPAADVELTIDGDDLVSPLFTANDDWELHEGGSTLRAIIADPGAPGPVAQLVRFVGAFPLPASSRDAGLVVTVRPGKYTLAIYSKTEAPAEVLGEVYITP